MEREIFRHRVQQRPEAQLPAAVADAVDDLAARRDHDLEACQRIALGEFPQQRDTEACIGRRRQRQRQRRQRARLDLPDVGERLALLVHDGFGEAQQANAGLRQLRRIAPPQQHRAEPVLEIGDRLADRRLRQIQPLGRPAEAAGLDHGVKAADLVALDLHGAIVDRSRAKARPTACEFTPADSGIAAANRIAAAMAIVVRCRVTRESRLRSTESWAVMSDSVQVQKGLEGVVADTTAVSLVDGEAGRLYYRGRPIESLDPAQLRRGPAPGRVRRRCRTASASQEVEEYLWTAGRLPPELATSLRELARHGEHPMATLQSIAPLLALEPPADQPRSLGARRGRPDRRGAPAGRDRPDPCRARRSPGAAVSRVASLRRALPATAARWHSHAGAGDGIRDHADPAARSQLQRRHVCRARRVLDAGAAVGGVVGRDRRAVRSAARRRRSARAGDGAGSRQSAAGERVRRELPRDRPPRDGHGPSRVSRRRSARARDPRDGAADRANPGSRSSCSKSWRRSTKRSSSRRATASARCAPTWSSTRASSTSRSTSRRNCSRRASRPRASSAGSRTSSSSARTIA